MNWLGQRLRDGSLVFFLLPIAYFLLYGCYGFADTDQGFVPALAWRITGGQTPYLDFYYVRPPLTPYLHALELQLWPRSLEMLGMRLDFYLMLWASVLWGILTLRRHVDFAHMGLSMWMLGILSFLYGAHNFPAMPWHTVDGIFLGSLGMYLLGHPTARWRMVLGLCVLALAGLAKQPFAILLPVGIALLFFLQPTKTALRVTLSALAILGAGAALLLLAFLPDGFAAALLAQTGGASSLAELLRTGLLDYLWPGGVLVVLVGGGIWWLDRQGWATRLMPWIGLGLLASLAIYPLGMAGWSIWKMTFVQPRLGYCHALLLCTLGVGILHWRSGQRPLAALLLGLGAIAWASSLSWGYAVPALFAVPGIFAFLHLLGRLPDSPLRPRRLVGVAIVALIGFWGQHQFPYREGPRAEMVAGAGDVFPALGGIRTSPENLSRLQELQALRAAYPDAIVLPAMPAADYLMGVRSTWPIDWEHDGEAGPGQLAGLLASLGQQRCALVEIARRDEAHSPHLHYKSTVLQTVLDTWIPGRQGTFYQLYTSPTKE